MLIYTEESLITRPSNLSPKDKSSKLEQHVSDIGLAEDAKHKVATLSLWITFISGTL